MKAQRLLVILTVLNLALLVVSLGQSGAVGAPGVAPVLRGRALGGQALAPYLKPAMRWRPTV